MTQLNNRKRLLAHLFGSSSSSVTSVTIPDGVTSIGDDAFTDCTSLTSVTLPKLLVEDYESFGLSADQVVFDAGVTMNIGGRATLVVPVGWSGRDYENRAT